MQLKKAAISSGTVAINGIFPPHSIRSYEASQCESKTKVPNQLCVLTEIPREQGQSFCFDAADCANVSVRGEEDGQ